MALVEIKNSSNWYHTIQIIVDSLSSSEKQYAIGAYFDTGAHPFIMVIATLSLIRLSTNTTDYNNCSISVYYR